MLRLKKIVLDGKIQPRVAISQDVIDDYCQAHFDGKAFPALTVFHDKKAGKYYLADGWHRYHAALKAKITEIDCDIKDGDMEAAIWFSVYANAEHGFNRTNVDKRRSIMTLINHPKWQKLSARKMALACGVSHMLVNQIYKEIAEEKAAGKKSKGGSSSTSKNKSKGKQIGGDRLPPKKTSFKDDNVAEQVAGVPVIPAGMELVDKFTYEEMKENYAETLEQNIALQKVIDADEPLIAMQEEVKKMTARATTAEARMNGLVNEKNEAIRHVKARDITIKKLKKQIKEAGLTEL
jgi:hypothetical protein